MVWEKGGGERGGTLERSERSMVSGPLLGNGTGAFLFFLKQQHNHE